MNEYQKQLYNELMDLVRKNDAFYHQDFDLLGITYRIFNYRLASYTDFLMPSAMQCRGTMFEILEGQAINLASLPMEKFFNLDENPMTMNLDLTQVEVIDMKVDGSLMSTYLHPTDLRVRLKSKGSLFSDHAQSAMRWLNEHHHDNCEDTWCMLCELQDAATEGWTVNLEWCPGPDLPEQRIVIGYGSSHLMVLNARSNLDGSYMPYEELFSRFGGYVTPRISDDQEAVKGDLPAYIASIPGLEGFEGVVATLKSGQRIKVKTNWYLSLHRAKDSINSDRRLFEAVLDEAVDDLLSLFAGDEIVRQRVEQMQIKTNQIYNHLVKSVEEYVAENKHLDRREFAIKGQHALDKKYFGLAMMKYLGKEINYKDFLKSHYKEFGIKDQAKSDPETIAAKEVGTDTTVRKVSKKEVRKMLLEQGG